MPEKIPVTIQVQCTCGHMNRAIKYYLPESPLLKWYGTECDACGNTINISIDVDNKFKSNPRMISKYLKQEGSR